MKPEELEKWVGQIEKRLIKEENLCTARMGAIWERIEPSFRYNYDPKEDGDPLEPAPDVQTGTSTGEAHGHKEWCLASKHPDFTCVCKPAPLSDAQVEEVVGSFLEFCTQLDKEGDQLSRRTMAERFYAHRRGEGKGE